MAEQDQERFVSPFGRPESLLFASPKRSNQEKGDPTSAPPLLRSVGSLRCSESVGRRELAHPCARTCAPFPAGFLRYSALHTGPRAERAPRPESIRPRHRPSREQLTACGCAARKADQRGPCLAAGGRRNSPKGRAHDARVFFASTWMCCRKPPEPERGPVGQDARRATDRGGLSLGYFSLATQREVTRAGRRPVRNAFDLASKDERKAPFAGQGESAHR